jgi:hypothetical protein
MGICHSNLDKPNYNKPIKKTQLTLKKESNYTNDLYWNNTILLTCT